MRMRFRGIRVISVLGVGAALPFIWAVAPYWGVTSIPWLDHEPTEAELAANAPDLWIAYPGVRQPNTFAAGSVSVPDDAAVVGVEVGGIHRAYLLTGMDVPQAHVVNDLVGGVPLSVAYCNLRDCATAYTSSDGAAAPLDLGVQGLIHQQLVLSANGRAYFQEPSEGTYEPLPPDEIPYPTYPCERTTWGTWRAHHPDSDIYLGLCRGYN
jgi:hypothetical protein